jgi:hypothetical protein
MADNSFGRMFRALGFQTWAGAKDRKPEEIADALEGMDDDDEIASKAAEKEDAARDKAAKDKAAKDKAAKDAGETVHPKGCMCDAKDCMIARGAKDASEFGEDEMTDADKLEEEEKKEKKEAKDKSTKDGLDADALILPSDEHAKSDFSTGDAAKHLLALKPVIAKSKDKGAKDAYNALCKGVRQVKEGVKDGAPDPFQLLTRISSGDDGANDAEIPMFQFFNGKPYAEGLKNYNDYQASRAAARR